MIEIISQPDSSPRPLIEPRQMPDQMGLFMHDPTLRYKKHKNYCANLPTHPSEIASFKKRILEALRNMVIYKSSDEELFITQYESLKILGDGSVEEGVKIFQQHIKDVERNSTPLSNDGLTARDAHIISVCLFNCKTSELQGIGLHPDTLLLDPLAINPVTLAAVDKFFANVDQFCKMQYLSTFQLNRNILLGYLFGKFDDSNPNSAYYKHFFRTYSLYYELDPFISKIINSPSKSKLHYRTEQTQIPENEQQGLRLLKGYWNKVFAHFWQTSRHVAGFNSPSPLSKKTAEESGVKKSINLRDLMGASEIDRYGRPMFASADAMQGQLLQGRKSKLQQYTLNILETYAGKTISLTQLQTLMTKDLSHSILEITVAEIRDKKGHDSIQSVLPNLAKKLYEVTMKLSPSFIPECFSNSFRSLSNIEQICLLVFSTFLKNGDASLTTSIEAVRLIDDVLIPVLQAQTSSAREEQVAIQVQYKENASIEQRLSAAVSKLHSLDPKVDGIGSLDSDVVYSLVRKAEAVITNALTYPVEADKLRHADKAVLDEQKKRKLYERIYYYINLVASLAFAPFLATNIISLLANGTIENPIASFYPILNIAYTISYLLIKNRDKKFFEEAQNLSPLSSKINLEMRRIEEKYPDFYKKISLKQSLLILTTLTLGSLFLMEAKDLLLETTENNQVQFDTPTFFSRDTSEFSQIINNEGELPSEGKPGFYTYGIPEDEQIFWVQRMCVSDGSMLLCKVVSDEELATLPAKLIPVNMMHAYAEEKASQGYLVRFNSSNLESNFQIPHGYRPIQLLTSANDASATWHPFNSVQVSRYDLTSTLGVVYEKIPDDEKEPIDIPIVPHIPRVLKEENAATIFNSDDRQILAEVKADFEAGVPINLLLMTLKEYIDMQGIVYDWQKYDQGEKTIEEVFMELYARKDGKFIISKMDCDQQSLILYVLAREVGIPVAMISGYQQANYTGWGGYNFNAHMMLAYQDNEGDWERFEATLPPEGIFEYPSAPEEKYSFFELNERINKIKLGILASGVVGLAALLGQKGKEKLKEHQKRKRHNRRQKQYSEQETLLESYTQIPESSRLAIWYLLLAVTGQKDVIPNSAPNFSQKWYSFSHGEIEPSPTNARIIAQQTVQLALKNENVGASASELKSKLDATIHQLIYVDSALTNLKRPKTISAYFKRWFTDSVEIRPEKSKTILKHLQWVHALIGEQVAVFEHEQGVDSTEEEKLVIQNLKKFLEKFIQTIQNSRNEYLTM